MKKPQLIIQDLNSIGVHNTAEDETIERLARQGSWKRQRIIVIIPSSDMVPVKAVLSWWNLAFPPNNMAVKMLALGMEVGQAYSTAIEQILIHPELSEWEYILTLEHDNIPPVDGVLKLIERLEVDKNLHCVGGLYFTKGEGGQPQIWGDPNDPVMNFRPQIPDPNGGLVECCGTGMGFNIWRLSMFKDQRLRRPWFKTLTGIEQSGMATQDLYFWMDARKFGYRCAIDCSVKVGHYDVENDIIW